MWTATLPRVRWPALPLLAMAVLGCSGSPPSGERPAGSVGARADALDHPDDAAGSDEAAGGRGRADTGPDADPLLARARGQVRQGRVSAAMQAKLAASSDPHHRHAARLLQKVAGLTPAPVLSRAAEGDGPEPIPEPEPGVEPRPSEAPAEPAPSAVAKPEPEPPADADPDVDVEGGGGEAEPAELAVRAQPEPVGAKPPRLADFEPGTLMYAWLRDAPTPAEPEAELPADPPSARPWPDLAPERSILLRERAPEQPPPVADASRRDPIAPRLVILTSLSLSRGVDEVGRPRARLEFAGAGAIAIDVLPIDDYHLRLSVVGAGAVPEFLAARPAVDGLEVVAVERHEHIIDVELEHGPGWAVAAIETLANGAHVELVELRGAGQGSAGP